MSPLASLCIEVGVPLGLAMLAAIWRSIDKLRDAVSGHGERLAAVETWAQAQGFKPAQVR